MLMRVPVSACREVSSLGGPFDRLFFGIPVRAGAGAGNVRGRVSGVAFRLYRSDEAIHVEADLPGIRAEDVEIDATGYGVSIRVERRITRPEGSTLLRGERSSWSVARSFDLPVEVDADRTCAELRDGVLRVTLPIAESARPRRVAVTNGEDGGRGIVDQDSRKTTDVQITSGDAASPTSAGSGTSNGSACCGRM